VAQNFSGVSQPAGELVMLSAAMVILTFQSIRSVASDGATEHAVLSLFLDQSFQLDY